MRYCILIALLPCAVLAQTSPPRPADAKAFQKLPQRLDWVQLGARSPQGQWPIYLYRSPSTVQFGGGDAPATLCGTCSIPLLHVPIPKNFVDRMSVPSQSGKDFDPKFTLPTPAVCEEQKP